MALGPVIPAKNWVVKIPTNLGVRTSTYSLSNLGGVHPLAGLMQKFLHTYHAQPIWPTRTSGSGKIFLHPNTLNQPQNQSANPQEKIPAISHAQTADS